MDREAFRQYPPHARELLQEYLERNISSPTGSVSVEDVSEEKNPD